MERFDTEAESRAPLTVSTGSGDTTVPPPGPDLEFRQNWVIGDGKAPDLLFVADGGVIVSGMFYDAAAQFWQFVERMTPPEYKFSVERKES